MWVAYTGQDTLLSVAVTDTAVYVGGHQKWMQRRRQSGADQQAGQVPRPGLAALDPLNGVPLSWNPGRNPRGVGAEELLATDNGLYVGSDTEYIGDQLYRRERLAFFPIDGGTAPVSQPDPVLPRTVYRFNGTAMTAFTFTGSSATTPVTIPNPGGQNWNNMRGAFMIGNKLVYGWNDGKMYYRTFDGTTYGPAVLIDPYNDPTWSNVTIGGQHHDVPGPGPDAVHPDEQRRGDGLHRRADLLLAQRRAVLALVLPREHDRRGQGVRDLGRRRFPRRARCATSSSPTATCTPA